MEMVNAHVVCDILSPSCQHIGAHLSFNLRTAVSVFHMSLRMHHNVDCSLFPPENSRRDGVAKRFADRSICCINKGLFRFVPCIKRTRTWNGTCNNLNSEAAHTLCALPELDVTRRVRHHTTNGMHALFASGQQGPIYRPQLRPGRGAPVGEA